jgi:hypothetical protein
VPAYRDGNAPFEQFTMRQLWCKTNWYQNGNPGGLFEDMGGMILNSLNDRTLEKVKQKRGGRPENDEAKH